MKEKALKKKGETVKFAEELESSKRIEEELKRNVEQLTEELKNKQQ